MGISNSFSNYSKCGPEPENDSCFCRTSQEMTEKRESRFCLLYGVVGIYFLYMNVKMVSVLLPKHVCLHVRSDTFK